YANYITPESLKTYREQRTGSYHGIGLKFRAMPDDYPLVIGALTGGPLEHSDLQPADQIIQADSSDLKGMSSRNIIKLLKGPQATSVNLLIKRNENTFTVKATRSPVNLEYARAEVIGDIGYLKISRFGGKTHDKVRALVKDLLAQSVTGIVLDLRANPGGSTRAARSITSIFVKEQHIYCERYKSGTRRLLPRHGEHLTDLPLTVLVNGDSMSASEIVAGALQTYNRGLIIGEPTFGKGLVQKVYNLAPPLGGAIRTTIAEFATPSGIPIHATGIVPDKFIRTDADFMFQRTGSLNISDASRRFQRVLLEQRVKEQYPDRADEYISAKDIQLQSAIDALTQSKISSRDQ
ncbi:MAG: S41 family peptidase, partial [Pseudomonadota bacterium]